MNDDTDEPTDRSEMTVGDVIRVLSDVDPALKLVDYAARMKDDAEFWEHRAKGKERLIAVIVKERDAAIALCKQFREEIQKLKAGNPSQDG